MSDATEPTRVCGGCGVRKPLAAFYSTRNHPRCRACYRAQCLEYIRERRELCDRIKLDRGCADCGYAGRAVALDFDHLPGAVKVATIAALTTRGTMRQLLDEIAKCEVICANCHRIRTADRAHGGADWDLRRAAAVTTLLTPPDAMESDDPGRQPGLFDAAG